MMSNKNKNKNITLATVENAASEVVETAGIATDIEVQSTEDMIRELQQLRQAKAEAEAKAKQAEERAVLATAKTAAILKEKQEKEAEEAKVKAFERATRLFLTSYENKSKLDEKGQETAKDWSFAKIGQQVTELAIKRNMSTGVIYITQERKNNVLSVDSTSKLPTLACHQLLCQALTVLGFNMVPAETANQYDEAEAHS